MPATATLTLHLLIGEPLLLAAWAAETMALAWVSRRGWLAQPHPFMSN